MTERICAAHNRPIQRAAIKRNGWTKAKRQAFLDTLAETCNVKAATLAAGMALGAPYALRKREPQFGALWEEALAMGYERLESELLSCALDAINDIRIGEARTDGADTPEEVAAAWRQPLGTKLPAAISVQLALSLLNRHKAAAEGRRYGVRVRRQPTPEETDAALEKVLDGVYRRLRAQGRMPALPAPERGD